jgi:hypothetical protein
MTSLQTKRSTVPSNRRAPLFVAKERIRTRYVTELIVPSPVSFKLLIILSINLLISLSLARCLRSPQQRMKSVKWAE